MTLTVARLARRTLVPGAKDPHEPSISTALGRPHPQSLRASSRSRWGTAPIDPCLSQKARPIIEGVTTRVGLSARRSRSVSCGPNGSACDSTPPPSIHPQGLTRSVVVLTVFPSPPLRLTCGNARANETAVRTILPPGPPSRRSSDVHGIADRPGAKANSRRRLRR
jgi:hypothetical protein